MENAYTKAGVDVKAGYELVSRIKKHVQKTQRMGTMGTLGGFGGCFDLSQLHLKEPVLVSGTDGVGTKLLLAMKAKKHDTIGIDCVAMCVNDIVAQGALPLYFLDYIATGKNDPVLLEQVVAGVAKGCMASDAALIGGETAEMPGLYQGNEYDLAGFAVGAAEKKDLVTGETIASGDCLIGLPSSGIHSNGYSLVRKIFFEEQGFSGAETFEKLANKPLMEELLTPTKIYVAALKPLLEKHLVKGIAHITGGGFVENIPRMLPKGLITELDPNSWPILPIFELLQTYGHLEEKEMYEIFNMGIGMVLAVAPDHVQLVQEILECCHEESYLIGKVRAGEGDRVKWKMKEHA